MAGHAGNSGVWINDANDSWATTTYYRDTPEALNTRNRLSHLSAKFDTLAWNPVLNETKYWILPRHLSAAPFRYTFRQPGGEDTPV